MHDLGGAHGLHLESLFVFASVATLELFVLNFVLHCIFMLYIVHRLDLWFKLELGL